MLSSNALLKASQSSSSAHSSPLATMSKATATCAPVAKAYGACVASSYEDISKGVCSSEFEAFKNCVTNAMGRKW
ncbi:hypothetical protein E3P92_01773 [Wallemia ichthyophaga]|uniref:IMS import disulfide relay-system CHCH-CHCH-like Cx9C domain-containing protein n=2 Tax=Wallemia ichthyophaga TaxID=245174 RepID=A0A4T0GY30_WALIC|nr:hypothetical protein E3P91_01276 [Wallemia ichthyophaga]TIA92304.1 hypothetical protein E3P97_01585 [Wallemia ichthyophaga]TIA99555.1 hypothetical protein E3P95_02032 [Wallemia ichthyophaga]TIB00618.1 hypothetical protein E3P94_02156 [Wallemia ichthyophaga]TIB06632.1 hypothetical protein E3P96_00262 [Wallemia ichthyophaga]